MGTYLPVAHKALSVHHNQQLPHPPRSPHKLSTVRGLGGGISILYIGFYKLGLQSLHDPLVVHNNVHDAVVDARLTAFPELDAIRTKTEASKVRRSRNFPHGAKLSLFDI